MRTTCTWLAALLLCGCSRSEPDAKAETRGARDYGPEVLLAGVYRWDREVRELHPCDGPREACVARLRPDDGRCWLTFSKAAAAELDRFAPDVGPAEAGEAWIEGTGRVSRHRGDFAQVHGYFCQIELTHVRVVDRGPPYAFRPAAVGTRAP